VVGCFVGVPEVGAAVASASEGWAVVSCGLGAKVVSATVGDPVETIGGKEVLSPILGGAVGMLPGWPVSLAAMLGAAVDGSMLVSTVFGEFVVPIVGNEVPKPILGGAVAVVPGVGWTVSSIAPPPPPPIDGSDVTFPSMLGAVVGAVIRIEGISEVIVEGEDVPDAGASVAEAGAPVSGAMGSIVGVSRS